MKRMSIYMCDDCLDRSDEPCIIIVPESVDVPHCCPYHLLPSDSDGDWYYIGDCE